MAHMNIAAGEFEFVPRFIPSLPAESVPPKCFPYQREGNMSIGCSNLSIPTEMGLGK